MANSLPGKDRLEYNHLKQIDPEAKVFQVIYNRCFLANHVPASWKTATTILIHKKGPSDDPAISAHCVNIIPLQPLIKASYLHSKNVHTLVKDAMSIHLAYSTLLSLSDTKSNSKA